ncbi:MAG: LamG domain-containing protein [Rhodocyclaceae bacterium]|nr:LamG domain-containing protein [Rhodocyclaceae bacterium]
MPKLRVLRLLNTIEAGTTTGSQLQTLLQDSGRLAEFNALLQMRGQARRMAASSTAMNAVAASSTAMNAIYASPTAIKAISPNAWAVYAPHSSLLTLSGSQVVTWANAEGTTARNMSQSTTASRPLFDGSVTIGGYQTLAFDGSNDFLQAAAAFNQSTQYTIFAVYRRSGTATHGYIGDSANDAISIYSTSSLYLTNDGVNGSSASNMGADGEWCVVRIRRSASGQAWASKNGSAETSLTSNIPDFNGSTLYIGRGYLDSTPNYFNGRIAEVWLIAGNGQNDAEIQRVTNLLRTKYGL